MARLIEKVVIILLALVSILGSGAFVYSMIDDNLVQQEEAKENADLQTVVQVEKKAKEPKSDSQGNYILWVNDREVGIYSDEEGLKSFVASKEESYVTVKGQGRPIFEYDKQYIVKTRTDKKQFGDINEAIGYARKNKNSEAVVYFASNNKTIWSYEDKYRNNVSINVQNILQGPELVNGSEVTSLTMLLTAGGVSVDKLVIAKSLKIDYTEKIEIDGKVTYGSPYYGYVGDMFRESESYGAYSQPIFDILQSYIYDYAVDITGCDFSLVERFLDKGYPVWVMTTKSFNSIPDDNFITYDTNFGEVKVTSNSQAVLVTGYDSNFVYINDPFGKENKVNRNNFIESFNQMGNQALSYVVH